MVKSSKTSFLARTRDRRIAAAVSLLVSIAVFSAGYFLEREDAFQSGLRELRLTHELRRTAVEDHFVSVASDVLSLSRSPKVRDSFSSINAVWIKLGDYASSVLRRGYLKKGEALSGIDLMGLQWELSNYRQPYEELELYSRTMVHYFDLHDIFLISADGDVMFTVAKEDDFGTNLVNGPYAKSALGFVFDRAMTTMGRVVTSYVERYEPSDGEPAMFAAAAIPDINGKTMGVFAAQLKLNSVDKILQAPDQVLEDLNIAVTNNDFLVLAGNLPKQSVDSLRTTYETESTREGFAGFSGYNVIEDDDSGTRISVFSPLVVGDRAWTIVSEVPLVQLIRRIDHEMLVFIAVFAGLLAATISRVLIDAFRHEAPIVE